MTTIRSTLALAGACFMTTACASTDATFTEALLAPDPTASIRPNEDLYAGLIGAWDVRVVDRSPDGHDAVSQGEWIFTRVLEGRAIEDVFITPPRPREPSATTVRNRYGASLRMFDPSRRQWMVVWMNPVSGGHDILWARAENGMIVQEGVRPDGQAFRWIFKEITPEAFHWVGDALQPDGSWAVEAEFFATRAH